MMSDEDMAYYEELMTRDINTDEPILIEESSLGNLYMIITDDNEATTFATDKTIKRTITYYQEILGIKNELFKIHLTCNWTSDGSNSYIKNLHGAYEILAMGVSCSWDSNYTKWNSMSCTLGLDYSYNFGLLKGFVICYAWMELDYSAVSAGAY